MYNLLISLTIVKNMLVHTYGGTYYNNKKIIITQQKLQEIKKNLIIYFSQIKSKVQDIRTYVTLRFKF